MAKLKEENTAPEFEKGGIGFKIFTNDFIRY